jgi:hypothetical protein
MVAQLEQDRREDPPLSTLTTVTDASNVSLDELAGRKSTAEAATPAKRRKKGE